MAEAAIISFAVETLGNLLIQKAVFLRGIKGEVEWLKDELKRMQCFLKDAAKKQADDERVRNWISEIREVAQDAEDAIELFILNVENARRSRSGLLERCACFPNHVYYVNKVGEEIESIRKRLQDIETSRLRYGIQDLGEATTVLSRRLEEVESLRRLAHWQKDKHVVGLEEDVIKLLENAILNDRELGISSATIEGMGGIGKSTLARIVYNHAAVAARFERRAWVVVSSEFRPREIIKELMLQLLNPTEDKLKLLETIEKLDLPNLQEMLHQRLQGSRYFIVVDDLWEDKHWGALTSAFPDEDKGSRLLLASRNRVITEYTRYVHSMKLLDPDESWKLFLKKAFTDDTDGKCPEELDNIGRQILSKCNGLPLAISVAGGLLVKQKQLKSEWKKVLKGINSHLGRSGSTVSAILELSYQNLPPFLKPCFLCLAFFKEDATIRAEKLIHIWIAQGFIPQEEKETMEEIGTSYLDELINRNIVQVKRVTTDDRIKNCQIHDLIRELSITKAKEEMSFEILREEGNSQSSYKPQHRAIHFSKMRDNKYPSCQNKQTEYSTYQNKHLRSLFISVVDEYIYGPPSSYWKSFKLLRVLDLEHCFLGRLPNVICSLIGLRYLGLRNTGVVRLPRSLGKLKNLLVLDLGNEFLVDIPNVIWKMDSLRYLQGGVILCDVPLKLSTLKNIQTLSCVSLENSNLEQLTEMTGLRKLGIDLWKVSNFSKLFPSLAKLENLVSLCLRSWPSSLNMEGLGTLHRITQLKLCGLRWFDRLSTDSKIYKEDPMPVLEKLPQLLQLKLDYVYDGEEIVISHVGFRMLKVLHLRYMRYLKNIQMGKGALPELKRLEINGCPNLVRLPEEVKEMRNLEELKMVTTTEMASKLRDVNSHIISNIPSVHLIGDKFLDFLLNQ